MGCCLPPLLSGCWKGHAQTQPPARSAGPISFQNVAAKAGLNFHWGPYQDRPLPILREMGCGCAFYDANGDGKLDILLVGESTCGLFLNRGDGTFQDASHSSGLDQVKGFWKGVAVGDVDGDGILDLVLTGYNCIALLKGGPGPVYTDVTAASGLMPQGWATGAGLMDLDGDGALDLVVGSYVIFNEKSKQYCLMQHDIKSGCPPNDYPPQFPHLYRGDGAGHFTDVTATSGMKSAHGKMLVVGFADFDADGKIDFYIGNDGMYADLMRNLGGMKFANVAVRQGVQLGANQMAQAAMGVDWGDYDRDGHPDFVVTDFADQPFSLFRNQGSFFELTSTQTGVAALTTKPLGFGVKWVDVDNDGWSDLVFADGHVYDNVHDYNPSLTYKQPLQLLHNERGAKFVEIGPQAGPDFTRPIVGRGLASGDFDGDGRVDLLVVDHEGGPLLLRNTSTTLGHWLELELQGRGRNRFAYGAEVRVRCGADVFWGEVSPASSYLSSSSPWPHFGLGACAKVDSIEVRWPDGKRESVTCDRVDRKGVIVEGEGRVR